MQNMKQTQRGLIVALFTAGALALAFFLLSFVPGQAYAKSYTIDQVDIDVELLDDASMRVRESRVYSFDGTFSLVGWIYGDTEADMKREIIGASVQRLDSNGDVLGEEALPYEEFVTSWRTEGGPSIDSYSYDKEYDTLYLFCMASNESIVLTAEYSLTNVVHVYKDIGEFYWKYISDGWDEPSKNVTLHVSLPLPQDTSTLSEDSIRAWGHGPLDGTVSFNEDGSITYAVANVNAGQFAEARIVFPSDFLTGFTAVSTVQEQRQTQEYLSTVLEEEQRWSDEANLQRRLSLLFMIACALAAVALLVWAIFQYFKYGKEYEPDFTDEYWRDIPSPTDHPAVIARLWRWNKESNEDFTATLIQLSHKGAIIINKGTYEKKGLFGSKPIDDYYFVRNRQVEASLNDPIDKAAMRLLFDVIGKGAESLWFTSIQVFGKANPQRFVDEMESWQGIVTAETNKRDFFELKSEHKQMLMVGVAVGAFVLATGASFFTENFFPLIFIVPTSIALYVIARYMPRRSREGNNLDAKAKALKNWLRDFSALNERPPTDVKVWGEFMVYAFIFGVAKQVIKALQFKVPELFEQDTNSMTGSYVPWWFWYSASLGSGGRTMPSASDMLQTSISNTAQTAKAALSSSSSGSGSGGGFSGGGGGGFGGGGGGFAR